ncbi:uncharacterized protein LOC134816308 isoform X2 [Bolinopsis microptera]|uniref:uncharacterized protein LOC134816308 isoform X2 n=1 Tax=Bolinopsis microptera TaxID=2820187 RepID=UPI0030799ADD
MILKFLLFTWILSFCNCDVINTESQYLYDFYNGLSGNDSWKESWNLYKGQPDSPRSEVLLALPDAEMDFSDCESGSESKCLTKMDLTSQGLVGTIPSGFEALTKLTTLILKDNEIEGFAVDLDFENNAQLEEINLSLNSIKEYSGSFPAGLISLDMSNNSLNMDISDVLKKIENAKATIETLNLSGNKIKGTIGIAEIAILNSLTALKSINLYDNEIEGDLEDISNEDKWEKLDLSYNKFSGNYPEVFRTVFKKEGGDGNARCNRFDCTSLKNPSLGETTVDEYDIKECYCEERGKYADLLEDSTAVSCETCADGKMANKWVRFTFWDESVTSYECETPTTGCMDCMFPRNCKAGACEAGSEGPTCETCAEDYRMIGGKCEKCLTSKVPIAALVLIVVLVVILGYGVFLSGLNILAATMIKQLFSYLQIYFLTMDIKANWPRFWGELGDVYKLSMMNSHAFDLECLTGLTTLELYYIHWASAVVWPIIMTIVVLSVDKSYSERIKALQQSGDEHISNNESNYLKDKQTGMRRLFVMFILIAFVPMTALSLRMYACESWAPQTVTVKWNDDQPIVDNQWFYDNTVSCNDPSLQGVAFLATMLLVLEFGVIVFLFLILFRIWRLFDTKDKNSAELFGALHESFTDRGLFCEPILLLRKFILIMTTQLTYLPPLYVAGGNSILTFLWLLLIVIRQPYIKSETAISLLNNWCNVFEIGATFLLFLTQLYAVINSIDSTLVYPDQDGLVIALLVLHTILVVLWLSMFIVVLIKVAKSGIKDRRSRRSLRSIHRQQSARVTMNPGAKVTPVNTMVLPMVEVPGENDSASNLVTNVEETDM